MDSKVANLIRDLETELLRADTRGSIKRLDELLSDDFFEIGASGKRYTKGDVIQLLSNEPADRLTMHEYRAAEIAPNTILANFTEERELQGHGQRIVSLRSSIWQRRNGRWQMIFHQGTVSTTH